jgi:hypothetical protein
LVTESALSINPKTTVDTFLPHFQTHAYDLKSKNEALKATDTTKDLHLVINPNPVMLGVKNSIRIVFLGNRKELEW